MIYLFKEENILRGPISAKVGKIILKGGISRGLKLHLLNTKISYYLGFDIGPYIKTKILYKYLKPIIITCRALIGQFNSS